MKTIKTLIFIIMLAGSFFNVPIVAADNMPSPSRCNFDPDTFTFDCFYEIKLSITRFDDYESTDQVGVDILNTIREIAKNRGLDNPRIGLQYLSVNTSIRMGDIKDFSLYSLKDDQNRIVSEIVMSYKETPDMGLLVYTCVGPDFEFAAGDGTKEKCIDYIKTLKNNKGVYSYINNIGGNVTGYFDEALKYSYGDNVITKDYDKAFRLFYKGAELGAANAQYSVGYMYYYGEGIQQDIIEAEKWLLRSAKQNFEPSQLLLANTYKYDKKFKEAYKWYEKLAHKGNVTAQYNLANFYYDGTGTSQSYELANLWLRKVAEQNHSEAQYRLALNYLNGLGVKKSVTEAALWFQKSAELGFSEAQFSVGCLYMEGLGVAEDKAKAIDWFLKASSQGHSVAQYNLAFIYLHDPYSDLKKAEQFAIMSANNFPGSYGLLGEIYLLTGKNKQSIEMYNKCLSGLKINESFIYTYHQTAVCLIMTDQLNKASEILLQISDYSATPQTKLLMADISLLSGDKDKALVAYKDLRKDLKNFDYKLLYEYKLFKLRFVSKKDSIEWIEKELGLDVYYQ